jgi:ribosomal protein S18 acetylase RimI-like enzyme
LQTFGLDPAAPDLQQAREFFAARDPERHLDDVLRRAGVSEVVMTNDPFDPAEAACWRRGAARDPRFHAVLRLDLVINLWDAAREKLSALGYNVAEIPEHSTREVRRFLDDWIEMMRPLYLAVSLPPEFAYPEDSSRAHIISSAVLPTCRDHNIPLALMIGVRRRVNPALREGGDGVGRADIAAIERLCADFPESRFLVTVLSRENQHELCVASRKFSNLMPFGCWWFLNNPSIVQEITRERLEMLGSSFIPQHSDARILEQITYKWAHSRRSIAAALFETYEAVMRDGWPLTTDHIRRDVERMFQGNFRQWTGFPSSPSIAPSAGVLA